jgi:histidine triad (HIT) family protein
MRGCVFCRIIAGEGHAAFVYQGERVVAFLDVNQASPGHTLIVPRVHVSYWWELTEGDAAAVAIVARPIMRALREAFQPDGIRIVQNNGRAAGQDVFHVHMHLILRREGEWHGGAPSAYVDRVTLEERAARIRAALERIQPEQAGQV